MILYYEKISWKKKHKYHDVYNIIKLIFCIAFDIFNIKTKIETEI